MHSQATIRVTDFPVSMTDSVPRKHTRIVIVGNPNSGKTTVFNRLTGLKAKVGNYPGITVEQKSGSVSLPQGEVVELIDVPGTYSLSAQSPDEQVTIDVILPLYFPVPDLVIAVIDATTLERSLYFTLQLLESGIPLVLALNMMDEAEEQGIVVDTQALGELIGAPVVPIVALKGRGFEELLHTVENSLRLPLSEQRHHFYRNTSYEHELQVVAQTVSELSPRLSTQSCRARATWSLLSLGDDELENVPPALRQSTSAAQEHAREQARDLDQEIIGRLFTRAEDVVAKSVRRKKVARTSDLSERLDRFLVHPLWGTLCFVVLMVALFEALFSGSEPLMRIVETTVSWLQKQTLLLLPQGPFADLLANGVIAGVGNVLVFVPQIALLCAFLALVEDFGYLARVAFLIDRLMKGVGLHGRAFVPLLSGFACAVPAIVATRTIENRRDRLITMLALPLMSCSARLPIFALMIATVFSSQKRVWGILSAGTLVLCALYFLSLCATLAAAALLRRTVLRGPKPTLIMELPPYRRPTWGNISHAVGDRVKMFLVDAGTIIVAFTVILWALLSFPRSEKVHMHFEEARSQVTRSKISEAKKIKALDELEAQEAAQQIAHSFAGRLGKAIEPVLAPLGFDWRIGIGIIGSFAAREVFVSTLGVVYGISNTDANTLPLRDSLRREKRSDGTRLFTPLTGLSLMIFFLFACQCMSTLAVVRRESGSWRWPALMFSYMTLVAYVCSLLIFQLGTAFGWGTG